MKKRYAIPLTISMLFVLGVTACGKTDKPTTSSTTVVEEVHVETVNLTASESAIKVGETLQLNVEVLPANATNKKVTYSCDNEKAEVSSLGVVTAKEVGTVIITATAEDNGVKGTLTLQILENNPYSNLDIKDYAAALESSPYSNSQLSSKEKYGLSNGGAVGVNQELIVEKYATIADSEVGADNIILVESIALSDVNAYFTDVTELNNYYKIQTAIYKAKALNDAGKTAKIKFPGGTLNVEAYLSSSDKAFVLSGLNGTYFEGNNTTIAIETKDLSWKGYLNITDCKNVHFNDINFDTILPSNLTGKVVDGNVYDDNYLTLEVDSEFNPLMETIEAKMSKPRIRSWVEFNQNTKTPLDGGNFLVDDFSSYEITKSASNVYTLKVNFSTGGKSRPRNGTLVSVQFSQYDAVGINIGNAENIYLENVEMYHASGMGLVAQTSTNLYVNRFALKVKEGSNALMTATADAMHFSLLHGDVHITNSLIEYSHDDALNIKYGFWYKLVETGTGSERWISVNKISGGIKEPEIGDKVQIYDEQTFEGHNPSAGYYTINSIEKTASGYKLGVKERLSGASEWGTCRVTFVSDTPDFVFSNNIVRNKRNRGVLVQVPNAVIENNAFMYVGHGSLQIASAMDKFNEATLAQGTTVKNNKFIGNCYTKPGPLYGDISVFAIASNGLVAPKGTMHDMLIENNFISRNGNAAVSFRGVGSSTVKDNLFNETSYTQPSGDAMNTIFQLTNCTDVTIQGNYSNYTLGNGLSGLTFEGTTAPSDVTAMDNINIKERENGEAGPIVQVAKTTKTITIDGNLSDWDDANALDIAIDGVSDAEGTERTLAELSDHFGINKLKMTWDDKGIYFAFDIFDNLLDVRTVNDFWLGDCVELFMSTVVDLPSADMQIYKDYEDEGVLQVAFAPTWSSSNYLAIGRTRSKTVYAQNSNMIQTSFTTSSDGYVGEVLIPFTYAPEFKAKIDAGKQIDMAIVVADAERTKMGIKRVQAGNIPHFVEDYKTKTERMPQYFFN